MAYVNVGLGFIDPATAAMIASGVFALYKKLFGCANPDSVSLDFDPEGRPGGRLYDKGSAETNRIIINDFQKTIWEGYGITQIQTHDHVWNPIFQYFVSHGGGWNIDLDSWAQIAVDFFNWLVSQGKQPDPRPYFLAHEKLKVAMKASCGSGRLKRKDFIPFSQIAEELYKKISGSVPPGGTEPPGGTTQQAGFSLSGITEMFKNPIVLGATAFILLMMFGSKKQSQPQVIYLPK